MFLCVVQRESNPYRFLSGGFLPILRYCPCKYVKYSLRSMPRLAEKPYRKNCFAHFGVNCSDDFGRGGRRLTGVSGQILSCAAKADTKKICVMAKLLFCSNTLCISRKRCKARAHIFKYMPQAYSSKFVRDDKSKSAGQGRRNAVRAQLPLD